MKKYTAWLSVAFVVFSTVSARTRVEEGNRQGILHLGNGAELESLDPHLTTGVPEFQVISGLLEGLVREDNATLEPRPGAAERWEANGEGTVYTFYLREDAVWSNGDPVTAHDFVFSLRRMLSPELGAEYAYMLYVIQNGRAFNEGRLENGEDVGVRAVDDFTLEITLEHPTPYFVNMLNHHSFYPVHAPTLRAHGGERDRNNRWARPGNYVGNGPFTLEEWSLQERIVLRKSGSYWNRENVRLNGIVFYPIEDAQTEERMFRSGLLHKTNGVPLPRIPRYQREASGVLYSHPYLTTYYYLINTKRKPFDDARVRKALALSIQRELITEQILKAGEKPATSFTPPGTGGFTPSQSLREDIEEAQKLLAEAGYPGGKGFPEFTLMYNTSEAHRTIAQVVQQMWNRNLGIRCQLANREWQVYMLDRRSLDFDVARAGWAGDYADPHNFLDLHLSTSGNNHTGWSDPDYDDLIAQAAAATDREKRFALYDRAEAILLRDMPLIPVYWYTRNYLLDPSVKGWHANSLDRRDYTGIYLESPE